MKVSIIQIVHPGTDKVNFLKSLHSVLNQSYKQFEYLIIGEGSENKILDIPQDSKIRFVHSSDHLSHTKDIKEFNVHSHFSRSAKKNLGAQLAQGDIVYFIDDDFYLEEDILLEGTKVINTQHVNMIAVHNTSDPTVSIWSKVRNFERDMYKYDTSNISCRFTLKSLFDKVGGFNESLIAAEDYDIHNRMLNAGGSIGFIDSKEIHYGEPKTWWDIMKKHYYYGKTMFYFKSSGGVITLGNASPIRSGYLKNWKKFLAYPHLTILFIFYQITRFTAGGLGYISNIFARPHNH